MRREMRRIRLISIVGAILLVTLVATSGRFLVVSEIRRADVIVVLAGETDRRPARGIELLDQGYAPRMILDVPAETRIYEWKQVELAQKYIAGLSEAKAVTVCPIYGRSTRDEARDVGGCLQSVDPHSILLVTADFHTRRALSTFRRVLPGYDYSVVAVLDPREFGVQWWRRREWAKMNLDEWLKLIWWELVERWR
jgi:uncharacterized SAM-binding protein YcdF (DUF218 family)